MPVTKIPFTPQSYALNHQWDGSGLWLLTESELEVTPKGTVLTSINGTQKTVGKDAIDTDSRFGYLAYGLYAEQFRIEKK